MKRPFLALILTCLAAAPAFFISPRPAQSAKLGEIIIDGENRWTDTVSSAASSTTSATGYLLGYSIAAYGDDVSYTVHFTSVTRRVSGVSYPQISSSTVRTVRDGDSVSELVRTVIKDPSIVVHGLDTAATVHVTISYVVPDVPGAN